MKIDSFNDDVVFNDTITTKVILETPFSKEIRILLKCGQIMKEHKAPFPIIVHVLEGELDFGVLGEVNRLQKGAIIALEENIAHDLKALKDSVVRLSLSKGDNVARVEKAANI